MRELLSFVRAQDAYFLLGLSVMCLFLLLFNVSLFKRLKKTARASNSNRIAEEHVGDISQCLTEHSDALSGFGNRLEKLAAQQTELAGELGRCLNSVGIVRFDAFEDVGGEQSFALALLDAHLNGVVVSSLYGRQDARLYAKGIVSGRGERPLSDEGNSPMQKASS